MIHIVPSEVRSNLKLDYDYLDDVIKTNVTEIYWEAVLEYEVSIGDDYSKFLELNDKLKKSNKVLYISVSAENQYYYRYAYNLSNIIHLFLPTFFFNFVGLHLSEPLNLAMDRVNNQPIDSLFLSLNNKPHHHRSLMMDSLSKYDLIKYGNYTWNYKSNFEYESWNEKVLRLDNYSGESEESEFFNLVTYGNPFIQLITESSTDVFFMSEKTTKPILLKQPFILLGSIGQNLNLKKYGFKLYDEIFDYNFDSKYSLELRVDGICKNLYNIKDRNYNELYDKISDKIEYNYNMAKTLMLENRFIDNRYYELYKKYKKEFDYSIKTHQIFDSVLNNLNISLI